MSRTILAKEADGWLGMIYGTVGPHLSITDHGVTLNLPVTKEQAILIEDWGKKVKWAQGAALSPQLRSKPAKAHDATQPTEESIDNG